MKTERPNIKLVEADSAEDYDNATELFKEYADELGVDLTFQNFDEELENITLEYSRPLGAIIFVMTKGKKPVGCAGIRQVDDETCELKRMYLRKEVRGFGVGKILLNKAIEIGQELGYSMMRLDTLPTMQSAINMYEKEGFYIIGPYRFNPIDGTRYYEKKLNE